MKKTLTCLGLLMLIISHCVFAQRKPLEEMEVDLGSGVFTSSGGLPFDVPFIIKGTVTPNLRQVIMAYRIKPSDYKEWMSFPETGPVFNPESKWTLVDVPVANQKFRLICGPLHPNVTYEFKFKTISAFDFTSKRKDFERNAFTIIDGVLRNMTDLNDAIVLQAEDKLNDAVKKLVPPGTEVVDADGNAYKIDFFATGPLRTLSDKILDLREEETIASDNLNGAMLSVQNPVTHAEDPDHTAFVTSLRTLLATGDAALIAILDQPVDKTNTKLKDLTLRQALSLIDGKPFYQIASGKSTIENAQLKAANVADMDAIDIFIKALAQTEAIKNGLNNFFNPTDAAHIATLKINFINAKSAHVFIGGLKAAEDKLIAEFPDILSDKLVSATYLISDQSNIDVVSQNTPYIGLDFGFAYTPKYSLFLYEGVNFYFSPVNKDAPLSRFTYPNRFWKSLSVHFGITQSVIKVEKNLYEPLISGVGSVLIGAGYRINRITRLNLGWMFFYEKDANPLIDKKHLAIMPTVSVTFDLNIAKALGGIATTLHL